MVTLQRCLPTARTCFQLGLTDCFLLLAVIQLGRDASLYLLTFPMRYFWCSFKRYRRWGPKTSTFIFGAKRWGEKNCWDQQFGRRKLDNICCWCVFFEKSLWQCSDTKMNCIHYIEVISHSISVDFSEDRKVYRHLCQAFIAKKAICRFDQVQSSGSFILSDDASRKDERIIFRTVCCRHCYYSSVALNSIRWDIRVA